MGIIYCSQNKTNGKKYIGQTRHSLNHRRKGHERWALKLDAHQSPPVFILALRKYGFGAFEWSIVFEDVPDEDLDEYEMDAISVYKTLVPNGYNLSTGGRTNGLHSEETKKKMSESHKNPSDESRRKMREANRKRKPPSQETREKMKNAACNRSEETKKRMSEAARSRQPVSNKTREKLSRAHAGRILTEEHKKKIGEASRTMWARRKAESGNPPGH